MSSNDSLRILHLLSQKPSDTGSGITVQAIIRESAKKGHESFLIAGIPLGEETFVSHIPEDCCSFVEFESEVLPFKIVGMSDVMPYPSTRFCDLSKGQILSYGDCFEDKLHDALRRFEPDIVHSNHLWILTSIARRLISSIPVVATCHGSDLRQFHLCPRLRELVLSGCSKLDAAIVLSSTQKAEVTELYRLPPGKVEIVGIGYDEKLFTPARKKCDGVVNILYAGKLSRAKGVKWLLNALSMLKTHLWHLDIAGSGTGFEKEEIVREALTLGERVTFHGVLPQKSLAELMKKAHIFVLPSFYEGFPLVLVEALACGCSLIATRLPGVEEIFSAEESASAKRAPSKDGCPSFLSLVPLPRMKGPDTPFEDEFPNFVESLTEALEKRIRIALKEPAVNEGEVKAFLRDFTWERVFERIDLVYRIVLGHKGPASGRKRKAG